MTKKDVKLELTKDFFTKREFDIVCLLIKGQTTKDVSEALGLKHNTISTIKKKIYNKLCVETDFEFYKLVFINELCIS